MRKVFQRRISAIKSRHTSNSQTTNLSEENKLEAELQRAHRPIEAFSKHFGEAHLIFAYHAAVPLALTPHLLYCLWGNFPRDSHQRALNIPWIAVADLLVSGLLVEVGYELYQMEPGVRTVLLQRLQTEETLKGRTEEIAKFILVYVQPHLKSNDPDLQNLAIAQQCSALAYGSKDLAIRQLGKLYHASMESKAELVRMESLVAYLAEPLGEYQPLLIYARSLGNYARGRVEKAKTQLQEVPQNRNTLEVAGVRFLIPKPIQTTRRWTRRSLLQIGGYGVLAGVALGATAMWVRRDINLITTQSSEIKPLPDPSNLSLSTFEFEVPTVDIKGEEINRQSKKAKSFSQKLGEDVSLEMVAIPGGKFLMGTEDGEIERLVKKYNQNWFEREKPQHEVTVPPFFMGKYLVTQAQWRIVASLPKIERDLNPNPSNFKGDDLPVEQVSWYDAVEFCQRLSKLIDPDYEYRLPSEAEWEYACRAGTSTPFYFGETITGDLANYRASEIYGEELKGAYREQTTPVGTFPPNAFGLYDMHGNVFEWCADDWHGNYEGAPTDGSAWVEDDGEDNDNRYQVIRGGCWDFYPNYCRSAYRGYVNLGRDVISGNIGFRVVCVAART